MEIICPRCGFSRDVSEDRVKGRPVTVICPKCDCRFRLAPGGLTEILPAATEERPQDEEDIRVIASRAYEREAERFKDESERLKNQSLAEEDLKNPWETAPGNGGWVHAFIQTVLRVMFAAPEFFRRLPPQAPWLRPFSFFFILAVFQALMERIWAVLFFNTFSADVAADPQLEKMLALLAPDDNIVLALLLRSGALILQLYAFSFLMFVAYRLMAPAKATFSLIYQIYAYSSAPAILCIIPGIGSLAATIWSIGCLAVGCKSAMQLDWPRTFFGFLPLLLIFLPVIANLLAMAPQ